MSIATELQNYADGLDDAYDAVNDMSGIIPQHKNMNNLDQAIRTIPQNTGTTYTAGYGIDIDANNEISIDDTVVAELSDIPGVMIGATSSAPGVGGTVPAPAAGDDTKVLSGAGTWVNQPTMPTVPTKTSDLTNDGDDGLHPFLATDDVATVATSGLYSDLTGTPTIPTVNDATLTIQHNGTAVQTFTANQSTNATANIETIYADTIAPATAVAPITTDMIANGAITPEKLKGYSTANTTDTWVPVSTGTSEIQHRVIAPFNANGTIPPSAIDWGSFYVSAPTPASNVAVNNTKTNIQSITLGAGKWRVCWGYRYAHSVSSTKYIETGLRQGTTDLLSSATNVPTDGNNDCRVLIAQSMEVNPTGTVTYSSWINNAPANTNGNCPNTSCYLYALRVG